MLKIEYKHHKNGVLAIPRGFSIDKRIEAAVILIGSLQLVDFIGLYLVILQNVPLTVIQRWDYLVPLKTKERNS